MTAPTAVAAPPPDERPTDGSCSQWVGAELRYCRVTEGVRRYIAGYRCEIHNPRTLAGLPPLPESPGIPAYRREAQA